MGLTVSAHTNLRFISSDEEACDNLRDEPGYVEIVVNKNFPGRAGTLCDGIYEGFEAVEFSAGSCSYYGFFRRAIAALAGMPSPEAVWKHPTRFVDQPFYEMVNFADNEGTLGTEVCAELARDFDLNEFEWRRRLPEYAADTVRRMREEGNWAKDELNEAEIADDFAEIYANFQKAFHAAAEQNGAVTFG